MSSSSVQRPIWNAFYTLLHNRPSFADTDKFITEKLMCWFALDLHIHIDYHDVNHLLYSLRWWMILYLTQETQDIQLAPCTESNPTHSILCSSTFYIWSALTKETGFPSVFNLYESHAVISLLGLLLWNLLVLKELICVSLVHPWDCLFIFLGPSLALNLFLSVVYFYCRQDLCSGFRDSGSVGCFTLVVRAIFHV